MRSITHIILHHTAAEEKDTEQIRRYHMGLGWRDIGYDFVIEKDGRIVTGRSLDITGAHAGVAYYNQHAIGIAVIGNLIRREIYDAQYAALVHLVDRLVREHNIPLSNILLHREIKQTACPGTLPRDRLLADLDRTKQAIHHLHQLGIIASPDYWLINAKPGQTVEGEYAAGLIRKFSDFIRGR